MGAWHRVLVLFHSYTPDMDIIERWVFHKSHRKVFWEFFLKGEWCHFLLYINVQTDACLIKMYIEMTALDTANIFVGFILGSLLHRLSKKRP